MYEHKKSEEGRILRRIPLHRTAEIVLCMEVDRPCAADEEIEEPGVVG